jgi:predicted AlkP superfamily pyrophosphatase or phosphodiesterase
MLTAARPAAAPSPHLIIISWDANANWVVERLLRENKLPNVSRLAERGVRADYVTPAFPSKTAPGHAAIWTGAYSDVNGVSGNTVPLLPRESHTLLEQQDGFDSAVLRAEPIWLTALLAGKRVVGSAATHMAPATPYLTAMKAAGIPSERFLSFDGFRVDIAPASVITSQKLVAASAWPGVRVDQGRAKEGSLQVGDNHFYVLAYDDSSDPVTGFDTVMICPDRNPASADCAVMKPAEAADSTTRWSKPFRVTKGNLSGLTSFRLFSLGKDGTEMTLYQRASAGMRSTASDQLSDEYMRAAGGSTDTGFAVYRRGDLGPALWEHGDGTAEKRLLEIVHFDMETRERRDRFALQRLNPDLLFDYSSATDDAGHTWIGALDPESGVYDAAMAAKIWPFYAGIFQLQDAWLGKIIDAAGRNAIVSLVGDHGMAGTSQTFYPNAVLERAGLLVRGADARSIDLGRTLICAAPWGDFFLSVNSTDWKSGIVSPTDREQVLRRATDALLEATDPQTGKRIVTRVFRPEEVVGLGMGGPAGGDLYLDLAAGYVPSAALSNDVVRKSTSLIGNGNHGFFPMRTRMQTVWFVAGPGIAAGKTISGIRQIDIAPTLSQALGIPVPKNAKGHIIAEALMVGK